MPTPEETADRARLVKLREQLLPDEAYEDEVAGALDCSPRTVQRLKLPFRRIGRRRAYSISGSREALRRPA